MSIVIRSLRAGDERQWRLLWTAYLQFYRTGVSEEVFEATFARLLGDDPRDFHGLIAEHDGVAMGLAHYVFHRHAWKIEDVCYLQDLYVSPSIRGRAVGQALIEAVYDAADVAGAPVVYWLTEETNTSARKLYDRLAILSPFVRYVRSA